MICKELDEEAAKQKAVAGVGAGAFAMTPGGRLGSGKGAVNMMNAWNMQLPLLVINGSI